MKIFATILTKDDPAVGCYTARTNFGTIVSGVSLQGPGKPLTIGQQVSVFEVAGQFGAFAAYGLYQSVLTIPGTHRAAVFSMNKAGASLGYIAYHVGNKKQLYKTGQVQAVAGSNLVINGASMPVLGVTASDFSKGDQVLIQTQKRNNAVIGWWNTVPSSLTPKYEAIHIYRPFFTASVRCSLYSYANNTLTEAAYGSLYATHPAAVSCAPTSRATIDSDDYFYSIAYFRDSGFNVVEVQYVKWLKTTLQPTVITAGEYPITPDSAYSKTVDDKFWWPSSPGVDGCMQSNTVSGLKQGVFPGPFDNNGYWLPKKGQIYSTKYNEIYG